MNVFVDHDAAGAMYFTPDIITIPTGTTISVTMVPPSGEGWTITGVESRPAATWSSNTATLSVDGYDISITASNSSKSGSSHLRITAGVKGER